MSGQLGWNVLAQQAGEDPPTIRWDEHELPDAWPPFVASFDKRDTFPTQERFAARR
jgi:hypothetical protein